MQSEKKEDGCKVGIKSQRGCTKCQKKGDICGGGTSK